MTVQETMRERLRSAINRVFDIDLAEIPVEVPPRTELGDLAFPVAFELAKRLKAATGQKQNPRDIATRLADEMSSTEAVSRVDVAGAGYLNLYLARADFVLRSLDEPQALTPQLGGKIIVEHTAVNPNKAAHIGHLRNAVLGDTTVRMLRAAGETVEVQNYIDNTGVQVADVVVGFMHIEHRTLDQIKAIEDKLGTNASPTGELFFDNCKVPKENLVGNEGDGFKICMTDLNHTRLSCGAGAVGLARACREASVKYANQRVQFGQKIGEYQMIQDWIAQMLVQEEAARLLLYRAGALKDKGRPNNLETSMAKYYAGETAAFAADCALKIYGAWGYSKEYPVERFFRDSRSYQIVEGSANIQKLIIAQDALGYRKANR